MAISDGFIKFIMDQLMPLGPVSVKKMFGGAGIYFMDSIFGIISDEDTLYFKINEVTKQDYEREGMGPFKPFDHKPMVMPYYEVPVDVLENRDKLLTWAEKAIEIAMLSPKKKKTNKKVQG